MDRPAARAQCFVFNRSAEAAADIAKLGAEPAKRLEAAVGAVPPLRMIGVEGDPSNSRRVAPEASKDAQ